MSPAEQQASTEPPPYYQSPAPECFCNPPTPWERRKYQGTWEGLELRTCEGCEESRTRLVSP